MNVEKFCGIKIFEWEEWDEIDIGELQFDNVKFLLSSMEKYNEIIGITVTRNLDGKMKIYNDDMKVIWDGYISDIPEVMEELNNRYRNERS